MDEHMKIVAERVFKTYAKGNYKEFFSYLTACGWKLLDVESMWEYANRQNERSKENAEIH